MPGYKGHNYYLWKVTAPEPAKKLKFALHDAYEEKRKYKRLILGEWYGMKTSKDKKSGKTKLDSLVTRLEEVFGKLPAVIKKPGFIPLMRRIETGAISKQKAVKIAADPQHSKGKVHKLLDACESPRTIYTFRYFLTNRFYLENIHAMLLRDSQDIIIIRPGDAPMSFQLQYSIYYSLKSSSTLPVSMKDWPETWLRALIANRLSLAHRAPVQDPRKSLDYFVDTMDLRQIRKINPFPSRWQMEKIERERYKSKENTEVIDESFSAHS